MEKPLISVIMPIYNVAIYLRKGIESIVGQTYANLEIILVDDGSTDESGRICDEFANRDSRIYVVHKENAGVSSARNTGLDIARGKYIYFIDGDDFCEKNLLLTACQEMDKTAADLVIFNYRDIYEDGIGKHRFVFDNKLIRLSDDEDKFKYYFNDYLQYKQGFEVWNRLYKRDIIEKEHIRFIPQMDFAEDIYFNFLYNMDINVISCIETVLYNRIQRYDSKIKITVAPQVNDFVKMCHELWNYCNVHDSGKYLGRHFYCLFARIMNNQIAKLKKEYFSLYFSKIENKNFYNKMNCQIVKNPYFLLKQFGLKSGVKQYVRAIILLFYYKF